jgi:UDP-N-acetylmuramyl pentapeptide phosphotransferase/UDP-N-acetylglucosamine-1-phosphate transferase
MDMPNARSSHKTPVPRGGGIAMISAALIGLILAGLPLTVVCAAILLAAVSFIDDFRGLPAGLRLLVQCVAVGMAVTALPGHILPGFVPRWTGLIAAALLWIWFINLTNFMDGIDGISAMQAIMVSAGIGLLHLIYPYILNPGLVVEAGVMAASAYGFYLFNRHPAKLFMGDVGSVPLGFLMGYLLLSVAGLGHPLPALILPAYYLSDATLTLLIRLKRGEKVWQAHAEHAYQKAVRGGLSHATVVSRISWLNAALIALAMLSELSMMAGILSIIAAYGLTFRLIHYFSNETH